jgi:uncharacterized damage-inducible protein DinB
MRSRDLLQYAYAQAGEHLRAAVEGLSPEQLAQRPGAAANPVGWLAWHALRVQDDHLAEVAGTEQVWTAQGFAGRFALPVDDAATGYGMSSEEVAAVRVPSAGLLVEYLEAVLARSREFLGGLSEDDLDRVVDERWDPPVTLGVRLVSVLDDDLQHAGQAAYARGLLGA